MKKMPIIILGFCGLVTMGFFQNCSKTGISVQDDALKSSGLVVTGTPPPANDTNDDDNGNLGVCQGVSCELTPLTEKAAVTTILIALGDEANNQLVVNGASAQLIAETVVRYSSPVDKPKILLVRDMNAGGESAEDTQYALKELLGRYDVTFLQEPNSGLKDSDLQGYDLVWFNNPGAPMGLASTRDVLIRFKGGVILQGDDLSWGKGLVFEMDALTGVKYIDNGVGVVCDGQVYPTDGNAGYQYEVTMDPTKIPGANNSTMKFRYGNDIDNTIVVSPNAEVLATAKAGPDLCSSSRPAIIRYLK